MGIMIVNRRIKPFFLLRVGGYGKFESIYDPPEKFGEVKMLNYFAKGYSNLFVIVSLIAISRHMSLSETSKHKT